jgi:hypothetical protein
MCLCFAIRYNPSFRLKASTIMRSTTSGENNKPTVWWAVLWLVVGAIAVAIGIAVWSMGRWIPSSSHSLAGDAAVSAPTMTGCHGLSAEQIKASLGPHVAFASDFTLVPYESGVTSRFTQINLFGVRHAWLLAGDSDEVATSEWWIFSSTLQFDTQVGEVTARFESGSGDSLIQAYYPQFEAVAVQFDENGIAVRCVRLGPIAHVRTVR